MQDVTVEQNLKVGGFNLPLKVGFPGADNPDLGTLGRPSGSACPSIHRFKNLEMFTASRIGRF